MAQFKPTEAQQSVLSVENKNIAVSASAGSGKTTVMIEKIAKYILNNNANVKNMLIVTFTNFASAEMKGRLQDNLSDKVKKSTNEKEKKFLIKQIENIESSNICTIDKFCINLLRKYYYMLNLDGNFSILEDIDFEKIKVRAFDIALNKLNESNYETLNMLTDAFVTKRNLSDLKDVADTFLNYLYVQENREKFLNDTVLKLYEKNNFYNEIYEYVSSLVLNTVKEEKENLRSLSMKESNEKAQIVVQKAVDFCVNLENCEKLKLHELISNAPNITLGNIKSDNKEEVKLSFARIKESIEEYKKIFNSNNSLDEIFAKVVESKKIIEGLIQLVKIYEENLNKIKEESNAYTFADVEYYVYKLLCDNEEIRNSLKNSINFIFVDEYQDVNELQEKLISLLANKNNTFLVGDVKQSIYAFRLSDPAFFINKIDQFEKDVQNSTQKILNENFRSDKNILEFINKIFVKCITKELSGVDYKTCELKGDKLYKNSKNYPKVEVDICVEPKIESEEEPKIYSVEEDNSFDNVKNSIEMEAQIILKKVMDARITKIENKEGVLETVEWKDIAILFRSRRALYNRVGELLKEHKIPVNMDIKDDVFNSIETRFLSAILNLIVNPLDDISLLSVISFPVLNISDADKLVLSQYMVEEQPNMLYAQRVWKYAETQTDTLGRKLSDLYSFINNLKLHAITLSVYEIYCEILKKFNLENYLLSLPNGRIYVSNLKRVLSSVNASSVKNVYEYVNFIKTKSDIANNVSIYTEENSVQLMTIHASKGLEYKVVILAETGAKASGTSWSPLEFSQEGVGVDILNFATKSKENSPVKQYIKKRNELKNFEEEKRLLYVALTRAKNLLIITATINEKESENLSKKELTYLSLILQSLKSVELQKLENDGNFKDVKNNCEFNLIRTKKLDKEKTDAKIISFGNADELVVKELKKYFNSVYKYDSACKICSKSSVSQLLQENNDGTDFNISPIKLETNESLQNTLNEKNQSITNIGTTYHKCLELLNFERKVDEKQVKDVLNEMQQLGFDFSCIDTTKILKASQILRKLITENVHIKKEQSFIMSVPYNEICESNITDEVLVQGVIDLLIITNEGAIIVDYKNTKITSDEILKKKYKKQLELYSKATQLSLNIKNVRTFLFNIQTSKLIEI